MPAIRSAKGKGKAVATRPRRQHLRDNVDPCEICGVIVSRKSDIPRHAKRHAPDAEKLPCPWEGCTFRTLQKSNLDTHYRRHTQDKSFSCTDDPGSCKFQTCDPASLLRHRKRLHGYIPRATVGYKVEKLYKHVHIRVIRGVEGDSGSVASQFLTFPSEPSTSGSSSSAIAARPLSPPDSRSPSPSPFSTPSPIRSFSPANSSGESEVSASSPSTPNPSSPKREFTPERSSPTVLSMMTSSPIYPTAKTFLFSDSLLLTKNYAWGCLSIVDSLVTPELLLWDDDSVVSSPGSELLHFEDHQPQLISTEEEREDILPLPLRLPDMEKMWPGYETAGQLNGSEGLQFDKRRSSLFKTTTLAGNHLPIGLFDFLNGYDDGKPEICSSPVLDALDLEVGLEWDGGASVNHPVRYDDVADQTTLVESADSIVGDRRTETNATTTTTTTGMNTESDLKNLDDLSSSNH